MCKGQVHVKRGRNQVAMQSSSTFRGDFQHETETGYCTTDSYKDLLVIYQATQDGNFPLMEM